MESSDRLLRFGESLHPATMLLRDLVHDRGRFEELHARRLGVNPGDYRAMGLLFGQGPTSPGRMAEVFGLTPSAMSNVIDRLIQAGHVERHRDDTDRRRMIISAADASRARVLESLRPVIKRAEELVRELTDDQQAALVGYLEGIHDALLTAIADLQTESDSS